MLPVEYHTLKQYHGILYAWVVIVQTSSNYPDVITIWLNFAFVLLPDDACNPNPCLNQGICQPFADSYQCTCPQGYSGTNCQSELYQGSQNNQLKILSKIIKKWINVPLIFRMYIYYVTNRISQLPLTMSMRWRFLTEFLVITHLTLGPTKQSRLNTLPKLVVAGLQLTTFWFKSPALFH